MDLEDLRKILDDSYTYNILYLDEILENSNMEPETKNTPEIPDISCEKNEIKEVIKKSIDELNDKEKTVITLYYYEELNLKEIGKILEVSESRVSQIHSQCLFKLRNKLKNFS
jgi:RNA polymerase sigma factor for flagellar operon FliA